MDITRNTTANSKATPTRRGDFVPSGQTAKIEQVCGLVEPSGHQLPDGQTYISAGVGQYVPAQQ